MKLDICTELRSVNVIQTFICCVPQKIYVLVHRLIHIMWNLTIKQDKKGNPQTNTKNKNSHLLIQHDIQTSFTQKKSHNKLLIFVCYSVTVVLKCLICSEIWRNVNWRLSIKFCRYVMCTWQLNAESRSDWTSLRYCMMQSYLQYCETYFGYFKRN